MQSNHLIVRRVFQRFPIIFVGKERINQVLLIRFALKFVVHLVDEALRRTFPSLLYFIVSAFIFVFWLHGSLAVNLSHLNVSSFAQLKRRTSSTTKVASVSSFDLDLSKLFRLLQQIKLNQISECALVYALHSAAALKLVIHMSRHRTLRVKVPKALAVGT